MRSRKTIPTGWGMAMGGKKGTGKQTNKQTNWDPKPVSLGEEAVDFSSVWSEPLQLRY